MRVAPTLAAAGALLLTAAAPAEASSLTLRPAAAPAGARITAAGDGFRPRTLVPLRLGGRPLAVARADASGRFARFVAPPEGLPPRPLLLTAGTGASRVGTGLDVLDRPPARAAPVETASAGAFRLRLSRSIARPGEIVFVSGAGLPPGALAQVALTGVAPVRIGVSPAGRFRVRLAIPRSARAGGRRIVTARTGTTTMRLAFEVAPPGTIVPALPAARRQDPLLVAAGDIACRPGLAPVPLRCHHAATGELAARANPDAVAPLGDLQYNRATFREFRSFDATWGRLKDRMRPAAGNHEYETPGADGYFRYFGAAAGDPGRGYYSYELGRWHVVVLNSNCSNVACGKGSAQERWLRADLAAHPARCTLAYWHHPRWTSGLVSGPNRRVAALWNALYDHGADIVLSGHEHIYERVARLDALGRLDARRGIRQFVVGTGGRGFAPYRPNTPPTQVAEGRTFGVLLLSLRPGSYSWSFSPEPPGRFRDSGRESCR